MRNILITSFMVLFLFVSNVYAQRSETPPNDRIILPDGGITEVVRIDEFHIAQLEMIQAIPINEILAANSERAQYSFRLEYSSGMILQGEIDPSMNSQFIEMGLPGQEFPLAELFWYQGVGYGHIVRADSWIRLDGNPLPNYRQQAAELLSASTIAVSSEDENSWNVDLVLNEFLPRDNPVHFVRQVFGEPVDEKSGHRFEMMIEASSSIELLIQLKISKRSFLVEESRFTCTGRGFQTEAIAVFSDSRMQVPMIPDQATAYAKPGASAPMSMMLLYMKDLAGWKASSHGPWAQRSLDVIQDSDSQGRYKEIYNPKWSKEKYTVQVVNSPGGNPDPVRHHPLIPGAVHEDNDGGLPSFYNSWFASDPIFKANPDYYYKQGKFFRDYNHFGYGSTGLKWAWYFSFRGYEPTTMPDDRYYSARDWGYGYGRINENLNRLTFTEAIKQYNRYSFDGTRNAYLMMGHVVHLLQDLGQPDHARNVAHPGSSMDEKQAYEKYFYCHILALEATVTACAACTIFCFPCSVAAYSIAEVACHASIDPDEMGFEKLIGTGWNFSQVAGAVKSQGVLKRANYDAYFDGMASYSSSMADQFGLSSALGCSYLKLIPPIPNADPDIDSDDPNETKPFYDLTNKIVPRIVGDSAGLIEYFYEIVNHPPIIERVAVVQWAPGATPRGFANLANDKYHCVRYDREWFMSGNQRTLKNNVAFQEITLDRPAYIFLLVGPSKIEPESGGKLMDQISLRLTGTNPLNGYPIDIPVHMTLARDGKLGNYYWGSFTPENCGKDPYQLTLNISGKDHSAHLATRNPSGNELDSDPANLARVNSENPAFPIMNYVPGIDTNHKLQIGRPEGFELAVNPKMRVIHKSEQMRARFEITLRQETRDCQFELYWGPVKCPAKWTLSQQGKLLGTTSKTGWLEEFHIKADLDETRSGDQTLNIEIIPGYTPGIYELTIECTVGEVPYILFTKSITVQIDIR